eukprot:gene17057-8573_t
MVTLRIIWRREEDAPFKSRVARRFEISKDMEFLFTDDQNRKIDCIRPLIATPDDREGVASILKCFYIMMAQAQVLQLPTMQEFESFNLMEIWCRLKDNEEATIAWCRQHRLLLTEKECDVCQVPCLYRRSIDVRAWPPGREQWILGGYEAETKKGFLLPRLSSYITADHPAVGGTEHNDMDGYVCRISNLPQLGFALGTVNHTLNFVASNRGNYEQSGGNVAEGQSKVQGNVRSNKRRNGGRLPF